MTNGTTPTENGPADVADELMLSAITTTTPTADAEFFFETRKHELPDWREP